ncbi:MAG TPA: CCA tRNA nucleotidyltransferase [Candidatus Paceibacterota bacterium]|nr:CCA tRNA nucleotidyltransferase [Candidatus Paceibacterota bacterium]
MAYPIPKEIVQVADGLRKAGYEAYLVGGCVRDLLLGLTPKDWDVTTNADPAQIQAIFPESFYENEYGTVGVKTGSSDPRTEIVEVTPYRTETGYTNKRHPDKVEFGASLEADLARRDFTVNAIALDDSKGRLIDPYDGQKDIKDKLIRAVGEPSARFAEDALRMLRAIRLVSELDFGLDGATAAAIAENSKHLSHVSRERVRDELSRILNSKQPMTALVLAEKLGILTYIASDLTRGVGVDQNQAHKYDVFEHLMRTMQHAADKGWDFDIRLAGLFHDVSKPETRRWSDEKKDWTFHGHEVVGSRVTRKALEDLRFPKETIEKVVKLVRWHMFFSDPDQITLSAVRRMIRNVGEENIWDLLNLRICDRIGTGRPKEQPFRFRKYKAMVEQALRDPISVAMLKTDGNRIMSTFHVESGPRIGWTLNALLEEVLDDATRNTREYLDRRSEELLKMPDKELRELGESGKKRREAAEDEEVRHIMEKHHVC